MPQDSERLEAQLRQSPWTNGPVFTGGLPQVPSRDALPAASLDYAGRLVYIPGTPSEMYAGMVDSAGDPEWVLVATGTTI